MIDNQIQFRPIESKIVLSFGDPFAYLNNRRGR
jgi:hypothetical protein